MMLSLRRGFLVVCLLWLTCTLLSAQDDPSSPFPDRELSDTWAVQLAPGADVNAVARRLGMQVVGQIGSLPDAYVLRAPENARSLSENSATIAKSSDIVFAHPENYFDVEFFAPSDPLFPSQWHLNNTGQSGGTPGQDIRAVNAWNNGYDGTGATVAIVDNGVEYTHPDLAPNYQAAGSQDFFLAAPDPDPMPVLATEGHGTAVAGLAVGADDGAACGVGVAYNAALTGIRFNNAGLTDSRVATFLSYARATNDIYSNSWGWSTGLTVGPSFIPFTLAALADNVQNGRGGRGNIYVFAGGNGGTVGENAGRSGFLTSRYVIAVGASDDTGVRAAYSERGSVLLVNAPGGLGDMVTTDRVGANGFVAGDCNTAFTGTSAAVPVVAGTAALVLDANPALNWRDMQYILTETADQNDPGGAGWFTNSAGYRFNTAYGYGRVNADRATQLAATWVTVPAEATPLTSGPLASGQAIPDNSPGTPVVETFNFSSPLTQNMVIEHVSVRVNITHARHGDIAAKLISPAGTSVDLMTPRPSASFGNYQNFVWMSAANRGESPVGVWRLEVTDNAAGQTGTLVSWQLDITGIPALSNDLFMGATDVGTLAAPFIDTARAIQTTHELLDPIPTCANGTAYRSAWYTYTPAAAGAVRLSTVGSRFNTVISVWTGTPGSFVQIGCDNDSGGAGTSLIPALNVAAGTQYYIMVSSYDRFYDALAFDARITMPIVVPTPTTEPVIVSANNGSNPPAPAPTSVVLEEPVLRTLVSRLPSTGEIPAWANFVRLAFAALVIAIVALILRRR